jgi:hypothetical protein
MVNNATLPLQKRYLHEINMYDNRLTFLVRSGTVPLFRAFQLLRVVGIQYKAMSLTGQGNTMQQSREMWTSCGENKVHYA